MEKVEIKLLRFNYLKFFYFVFFMIVKYFICGNNNCFFVRKFNVFYREVSKGIKILNKGRFFNILYDGRRFFFY